MYLKEFRQAARIPAQEMADMLGVTVHGYRRWERGEVEPKASQVIQLSKILQMSVDTLLMNKPDDSAARKITISVKPGELQTIEILGEAEPQKEEVYTPSFKLRNTKRKKVSSVTKKAAAS